MLENYYKGDKVWFKYVSNSRSHDELLKSKVYTELYNQLQLEDLSRVIFEILGEDYCIKWICEKNPELENLRPIDCRSGNLLLRLRVLLLRMYY